MIIGVDAQAAAAKKRTGVENMTRELIHALLDIDQKNSYFLYSNLPLKLDKEYKNVQILHKQKKRFWHRTYLPAMIDITKPDVFIEPSYMLPKNAPANSIIFVLDLASKLYPKAYSLKQRIILNQAFKSALRAKEIVFISKSTQDDFNKYYPGFPKKQEHVIYPGVADTSSCHDVKVTTHHKKYILYVGRIEDKKNIKNLIEAFALAKVKYSIDQQLVLAGKPGYGYNSIIKEIVSQPLEIQKEIQELGYVNDKELACLYKNADLFVYPSIYEGFGMPILEAFSYDLPVACAKISSMPEAAGGAAIYFDPNSTIDIAKSMTRPLEDKSLREELIKKGQEQLKKFSWSKAAKELLDIINKANS